jgi:cytochrome P450
MPKDESGALPGGRDLTAANPAFRRQPQAFYDRLRRHAPWYADNAYERILLTGFDAVNAALRHKQFSVDARRARADAYVRRIAGTGVVEARGDAAYTPPLVLLDDPDHRRIRGLVSRAFNPRAIEALAPRIEAITDELLDALADRDCIDFIDDFAGPLPTRVIMAMMGLEDAAPWSDMKRWSEAILWGYDPERDAATQQRLREAFVRMGEVFRAAVEARRRTPGDDLISAMVRAQEAEDRLTELEIVSLCTQLMVAGNVTTTDLMGNGLAALFAHPEALAALRAEPGRIDDAVEEMLRIDCPITETARIPTGADRLCGHAVAAGETLTLSLAAANHDPARFPDPHRFRLDREANDHLAFGRGVHVCLGAPLARLEARIAFTALLRRYPAVSADGPGRRRALPFFSGYEILPVRLGTPATP